MKLTKYLLGGTAAMAMATSAATAQDASVKIGDLTWTGARAIGYVIKAVIDGPLDSEAEIVEGLSDGNVIAAGMDKGDGSVDVYSDLWMPNRQNIWDAYIDGAKTVGANGSLRAFAAPLGPRSRLTPSSPPPRKTVSQLSISRSCIFVSFLPA